MIADARGHRASVIAGADPGAPSTDGNPSWSPDGTRVAVDDAEAGGIHVLDVASGHRSDFAVDGVSPAWSPRGATIAFVDLDDGTVWGAAPNGGGRHRLLPPAVREVTSVAWSPDGKTLAYSTASGIYLAAPGAESSSHLLVAARRPGTPELLARRGLDRVLGRRRERAPLPRHLRRRDRRRPVATAHDRSLRQLRSRLEARMIRARVLVRRARRRPRRGHGRGARRVRQRRRPDRSCSSAPARRPIPVRSGRSRRASRRATSRAAPTRTWRWESRRWAGRMRSGVIAQARGACSSRRTAARSARSRSRVARAPTTGTRAAADLLARRQAPADPVRAAAERGLPPRVRNRGRARRFGEAGHVAMRRAPVWSPDGLLVACAGSAGRVAVADLAGHLRFRSRAACSSGHTTTAWRSRMRSAHAS